MEELERRLVRAIKEMRRFEITADVPILFIVENQPGPYGSVAPYLLDTYQKLSGDSLGRIIVMRESGQNNPKRGVFKTAQNTDAMVRYAATRMRFNQVHFSQHLTAGEEQTPDECIEKFLKQMDGFKLQQKVKSDKFAEAQFKWMGEDKDDLIVSAMHAMFWEHRFWLSDREDYEEQKRWL